MKILFIIFIVIVLIWFLYEMLKPNEDITNDLEFLEEKELFGKDDQNK